MNRAPTEQEVLMVAIAVTVVMLVIVLMTWAVMALVRRRLLAKSGLEQLDPLRQLLDKNKSVLTEEETRLLRYKMAERLLDKSGEDKQK